MQVAIHILGGTPAWVFALLAYFIWQGIQSLKTRMLPVWRVLIVPAVFIAMGLSRIAFGHEAGWISYLPWFVGAFLFAPLALVTGPRLLSVDRGKGQVTRPGSPVSLIRNVTVFTLQYGVAVAAAMQLEGHAIVVLIGHAVSGAEAGYFAGWVAVLLNRYRKVNRTEVLTFN